MSKNIHLHLLVLTELIPVVPEGSEEWFIMWNIPVVPESSEEWFIMGNIPVVPEGSEEWFIMGNNYRIIYRVI